VCTGMPGLHLIRRHPAPPAPAPGADLPGQAGQLGSPGREAVCFMRSWRAVRCRSHSATSRFRALLGLLAGSPSSVSSSGAPHVSDPIASSSRGPVAALWKTLGSGNTGACSSLGPSRSRLPHRRVPLRGEGTSAGPQEKGRGERFAPVRGAGRTRTGAPRRPSAPFAAPSLAAALRLAPLSGAHPQGGDTRRVPPPRDPTRTTTPPLATAAKAAQGAAAGPRCSAQRHRQWMWKSGQRGSCRAISRLQRTPSHSPSWTPGSSTRYCTALSAPPKCPLQDPPQGNRQPSPLSSLTGQAPTVVLPLLAAQRGTGARATG